MPQQTLTPHGPGDWDVLTTAVKLGLSENSIRRAIAAGTLPHRRIGPAARLIRVDPAAGYAWRGIKPPADTSHAA